MLDTNISPGEITHVHTHQFPASLYIISWSDFIRYDDSGNIMADSKALALNISSGSALWSGPLHPHVLKNVGEKNLHAISVELKSNGGS